MAAINVRALLTGNIQRVTFIEPPSRLIRIYLCSTATDMNKERRVLMEKVYPQVREHCREKYNLEFQVVDPHAWPGTGEWSDICSDRDVALDELSECQRLSTGPNFLVLIGQRYGDVHLPSCIPANQYEAIKAALLANGGKDSRAASTLDVWYKKDNNALSPLYYLQNIYEVDTRPLSKIEMLIRGEKESEFNWEKTKRSMLRLLQKGATLVKKQDANFEEDRYFTSDLERQISIGVQHARDAIESCLAFRRHITDLKNYTSTPLTSEFTDIRYDAENETFVVDAHSQQRLESLVDNSLESLMSDNQLNSYSVLWKFPDGIDCVLHDEYLSKLCDNVQQRLMELIDEQSVRVDSLPDQENSFIKEVTEHWRMALELCANFYGQQDLLAIVHAYVISNDARALVLHGAFGSGRTSLLAKSALEVSNWVIGDVITVVRFVGATVSSTDVCELLHGICRQIALALGNADEPIPEVWPQLSTYLADRLATFPDDKNLVILLAGVADLSTLHQPHQLDWIPSELNENVKLILTASPSDTIFHTLVTNVVQCETNYVDMSVAERAAPCGALFDELLWRRGRCLNTSQRDTVARAICECPSPLYATLLLEDAIVWRSTADSPNVSSLPDDATEYVSTLLARAELQFGVKLVSHALTFISASVVGISDAEMDDLLSLDDDVLYEFYEGVPNLARMPSYAWLRVKRHLAIFFRQQIFDGVNVCVWSRRGYAHIVRLRYGFSNNTRRNFHSLLAEYFMGDWHKRPKPFVDRGKPLSSCNVVELDRYVPAQPLCFIAANGSIRYNLRQYDQVPRQLSKARRLDQLNDRVLFNYEWLYNKSKALSLDRALEDFKLNPGAETSLVARALTDAKIYIDKSIDCLAAELAGRLLAYRQTHANIAKLIDRCDEYGAHHCALLPNFPYQQTPGSALKYTVYVPGNPTCFALITCTDDNCEDIDKSVDEPVQHLLVKEANCATVYVYDMNTGVLKTEVVTSVGRMYVTPDGNHFIIINEGEEKSVKVHDTLSGKYCGHFVPANHIRMQPKKKYRLGPLAVTDELLCITMSAEKSYVCLVEIPSCKLRKSVNLLQPATICGVSADGKHLFTNSGCTVKVFVLETLQEHCCVHISGIPNSIIFNSAGTRALMSTCAQNGSTDAQHVTLLVLRHGIVDFDYTFSLPAGNYDESANSIRCLRLSHDQTMLLIATYNILVLYDAVEETILHRFGLPPETPDEFLLPKRRGTGSVVDIRFTDACFSPDDKFLLGAVFRSVCVWHLPTGHMLARLQAPVGVIDALRVSTSSPSLVITHVANTGIVQAWNIGDALGRSAAPDRLTTRVEEIRLADGRAFVRCRESDEIGIVNMCNGRLLDLLTHSAPVVDFAVTIDASRVLVCLQTDRSPVNKIWDVSNRQIIHEFGSLNGRAVALRDENALICIHQRAREFKSPYEVSLFRFPSGNSVVEQKLLSPLNFLLSKPFVTPEDRYLIVLSAKDYDYHRALYVDPAICAITLTNTDSFTELNSFSASELRDRVHIKRILDVRPYERSPYIVIVLYTNEPEPVVSVPNGKPEFSHCYDFMMFDVCSGVVCQRVEALIPPDACLDAVLFTKDISLCIDEHSNVFDMRTGFYLAHVKGPEGIRPQKLALDDSILLYHNRCLMYAVRMHDGRCIAQLNVHALISCIEVADDDHTVLVGCEDGRLMSYTLVDDTADDFLSIVADNPSRKLSSEIFSPDRVRSWDKLDSEKRRPSARPPSAIYTTAPSDKTVLLDIKPLYRKECSKDNNLSKACVIM